MESRKNIIILGGGGHAKVIASVLQKDPNYAVLGFLDDDISKTNLLSLPKLGAISPIDKNLNTSLLVIGIGHIGKTVFREELVETYERNNFLIEGITARSAILNADVTVGKGTVIFDGVIVQPGVTIGDYSIINTKASIDHDCQIGNHTHIAPGVTMSGNVKVGNRVLIGTGASVIQGITIADDCIIGAGAVVTNDCTEKGGVYVGVPATFIKQK